MQSQPYSNVMTIEATFTVAADEFPLGSVFEEYPEATVELERIVPGPRVVVPYFWVRGVTTDHILAAFREHPGVEEIQLVDSVDGEYLMRVEWAPEHPEILVTLAETDLTVMTATGTHERWTFEIRGENQNDIAEFQTLCRGRDIPITLTALHALTPVEEGISASLTSPQKEGLLLAYERGYFNSPRDVTMAELGDELGISRQAVAARLRRGIRHVLEESLPTLQPG